jgi:hypothetical protein
MRKTQIIDGSIEILKTRAELIGRIPNLKGFVCEVASTQAPGLLPYFNYLRANRLHEMRDTDFGTVPQNSELEIILLKCIYMGTSYIEVKYVSVKSVVY